MIEQGKPIVTLVNRCDQAYLHQLAGLRNDPKEELGIKGQFDVTSRNSRESHFFGLMGEFAVARLLDVEIDESISLAGDKHRPDLVWNGWGVEVKVARYAPPILKFMPSMNDFGSDIAVLCYCDGSAKVEVHGWISRSSFWNLHYLRNFGWGIRACLDADLLRPMSDLNQIIITREEWQESIKHEKESHEVYR